jgi:ADP-heptose:LPS heptosyltransferase
MWVPSIKEVAGKERKVFGKLKSPRLIKSVRKKVYSIIVSMRDSEDLDLSRR